MTNLSLIMCLLICADDSATVLQELGADCRTGSLIFSQGDCLAVKVFSQSRFTHCAAVVIEDGQPIVYDAMNGSGVRRQELADYLRSQTPGDLQIVHPAKPLTNEQSRDFLQHLQSQLGRAYGIKHHLTGQRAPGIHCAEYCTDALLAARCVTTANPPRVSPGSLFEGLMEHQLYTDGGAYVLRQKSAGTPPTASETWCQWAWRGTRDCTTGCCRQMSRWFLCRDKCGSE